MTTPPTGDRSQVSSADRQDSDGEDSDVADDDENEDNEEEEDDSQAESGLSTNPSVCASPQHAAPREADAPSREADAPPSSLLAQMSISSVPLPLRSPAPESYTSDSESVAMMSPLPPPHSPPPAVTCSESNVSDSESVAMMSPVSPCRQMSIDYPDCDVPPSPPVTSKSSKLGQVSHRSGWSLVSSTVM